MMSRTGFCVLRTLGFSFILSTFFISLHSQADIVAVFLSEEAALKKNNNKYDGFPIILIQGIPAVVGEHQSGIIRQRGGLAVAHEGIELIMPKSPSNPSKAVPYKVLADGTLKKEVAKAHVLKVKREDIRTSSGVSGTLTLASGESLFGLKKDYEKRLKTIKDIQTQLKRLRPKTQPKEWLNAQLRLNREYERLIVWSEYVFPDLSKKHQRDLEKNEKKIHKQKIEALAEERKKKALSSIKKIETPSELSEIASKYLGTSTKLRIIGSQHLKLTYPFPEISDELAETLVNLGENIIEQFQREFIDPYTRAKKTKSPEASEESSENQKERKDPDEELLDQWANSKEFEAELFENRIPETRFHEFALIPNAAYEALYEEAFGFDWGPNRDARLEMGGSYEERSPWLPEIRSFTYWRFREGRDWEALIAHQLGHSLYLHHFARGERNAARQPWIFEGLGFYLSDQEFGRVDGACTEFRQTDYVAEGGDGRALFDVNVLTGRRTQIEEFVLSNPVPIDYLGKTYLKFLKTEDTLKAWLLVEFLAKKKGMEGQKLLMAMSEPDFLARSGNGDNNIPLNINLIQRLTAALFDYPPGRSPLQTLNKEWESNLRSE